jgi:hypothetical protein
MQEQLLITIEIKPQETNEDWYLEITNTITGKSLNAQTLEDMNSALETFYALYPGSELIVNWLPSPDASEAQINDVRNQINEMQKELN